MFYTSYHSTPHGQRSLGNRSGSKEGSTAGSKESSRSGSEEPDDKNYQPSVNERLGNPGNNESYDIFKLISVGALSIGCICTQHIIPSHLLSEG